jgi:ATP-dependent Zn protease
MNHALYHGLAYHEAGHLVAGVVQNLNYDTTTIVREGDLLGFTTVENPHPHWRRGDGPRKKPIEQYLVVLFAGRAGEELAFPGSPPQVDDGHDLKAVEANIKNSPVRLAFEDTLRRRARRLLAANWNKVRISATKLLKHGTLPFEDVERLIGDGA